MSATVMNLPLNEPQTVKLTDEQSEKIESVKCHCCGLTEECTNAYISRIKERYKGKWVCGLCAEAVKDEVIRNKRLITTEEALNKLVIFRKKVLDPPRDSTMDLVVVMRQILRRSCSGSARSMPSSPRKKVLDSSAVLLRSGSCFSALSLAEDDEVANDDMVGDEVASDEVAEEGGSCEGLI